MERWFTIRKPTNEIHPFMAYEESHTIISIDIEMAFINVQCLFSHDKNSKNFILNLIRSVLPDP